MPSNVRPGRRPPRPSKGCRDEAATPNHVPLLLALGGLGLLGLLALGGVIAAATLPRRAAAQSTASAPVSEPQPTAVERPTPPAAAGVAPQPTAQEPAAGPIWPAPPTPATPQFESDPPAPAEPKPQPPQPREDREQPREELIVKRIQQRTAEELIAQASKAPSLKLDRAITRGESIEAIRLAAASPPDSDVTPALLARRRDLAGLPIRRGPAARLTPAAAAHLSEGAGKLQSTPTSEVALTLATGVLWHTPERVPALMQVLMVEPEDARVTLARHLGRVEGKRAAAALAQVALYDPAPNVRDQAIASLRGHPAADYLALLLRGFASPWPPVAEHAAEALAALRREEAAPALLKALNGPDPQAPYGKGNGPPRYVRELVRINHRVNCLMCHPPSFRSTDPLRAAVPPLREPVRVSFGYFSPPEPKKAAFVRADVTYLKQDYSVKLQGERYDLFVRERMATDADLVAALARKKAGPTPHQKAVAFALRELSGEEPGPRAVNWVRFAEKQKAAAEGR